MPSPSQSSARTWYSMITSVVSPLLPNCGVASRSLSPIRSFMWMPVSVARTIWSKTSVNTIRCPVVTLLSDCPWWPWILMF